MKRLRRFTLWMVIVCLMAALLAVGGCGKGETDADKTGKNGKDIKQEDKSLMVYSGAGLRKPMDQIGEAFEKKTGVKINFNYAGCAQLLGQMELTKEGDIFVGGSLNDMEIAQQKEFTKEYHKVVYHIPAILVKLSLILHFSTDKIKTFWMTFWMTVTKKQICIYKLHLLVTVTIWLFS
jgi:molybdate transport system substrate-binding protein